MRFTNSFEIQVIIFGIEYRFLDEIRYQNQDVAVNTERTFNTKAI